jgi:MFS transporter, SHS family, sialic acid transporter
MPAKPPVTNSQWLTLIGATAGWALDGFDFMLPNYILLDIAREFHLSLTVAGTVILAAFFSRWLGGAALGSIGDRLGRKVAMNLGVLTFSVATFLCGLSWSYWSLIAFRLLVGLGMAGEYAAGTTLLVETWPASRRNRAAGIMVAGWGLGGFLAASAYTLIVPRWGWRALFFAGILPAFLTVFIRYFMPESPEWTAAKALGTTRAISFLEIWKPRWLPLTLTILISTFALFGQQWPFLSLLPTYLRSIGYESLQMGRIMSVASGGSMLGYAFGGVLADWIGYRRSIVTLLLVSIVFLFAAMSAGKAGPIALGLLMFALMFFAMGVAGVWPVYISSFFTVDVRSSGLGVTYNLGAIAGGLSPVWGGMLQNFLGLGWAIVALVLFWSAVLLIIVGCEIPVLVATKVNGQKILTEEAKIL